MESTGTFERHDVREEIRERRGWLVPLGILLIVLGLAAVFATFAATLATVIFFGVVLLVGGIAQLAQALADRDDHFGWALFGGLLYLLTGGLMVFDPVSGAIGLTLLLAMFFVLAGVVRLSHGVQRRSRGGGGGMVIFSGALDLVLGALIIAGWPASATWVIGLFLGIELVIAGTALMSLALAARHS
jgi:uncharacterized membrane protein HdeD (DUF308 family)